MKHELKTWPEYFQAIKDGVKTFEVRKNDRDYQVGDILLLCEYDPNQQRYTGNTVERRVTYVLKGVPAFGITADACVMSLAATAAA